MQIITRDQILKRFQSLPASLQEAIFAEYTSDSIIKYCTLRDIPEEKMYLVGKLTSRVLLGYLRLESFASEIQKETGVSEMTAQLVAHDIDGEIFSAVRLELKKLYPPVIQTPTVQSWRTESGIRNQELGMSGNLPPAKPKYVIPIPEKFMKREVWSVKQEEAKPQISTPLAKDELGIKNGELKTNSELRIANQEERTNANEVGFPTTGTLNNSTSSPQRQINKETTGNHGAEARPQKTQAQTELSQPMKTPQEPEPPKSPQPEFKPIVPLPTFIRSQFKAPEQIKTGIMNKELGIKNGEEKQKKAEEFVSKFSAPDPTLAKPEAPKTDPYKESL